MKLEFSTERCPTNYVNFMGNTTDPSVRGDFGWALAQMKAGGRMCRRGWNGRGVWTAIQRAHMGSVVTVPFIYLRTVSGDTVPWTPSQADVLAEDWERVLP